MFTIAHLTDPHLGPLPRPRRRDLVSKRLVGYYNWHRSRAHAFSDRVLAALIEDMHAGKPDHIVVTGDLVNIALPAEMVAARVWLAELGAPDTVTVIPGNHDAYVPGAMAEVTTLWRDFMFGDNQSGAVARFPFVRRRGPVAFIGLSTAVATAPFMATGRLGSDQAAALGDQLALLKKEGLFRVVLIHHPPIASLTSWSRRLIDGGRFRSEIAKHGAELVLHGHNHRLHVSRLAGPDREVPVVGAAAASSAPDHGLTDGAYNLYRIGGTDGNFTCTMSERGIRTAGDAVETLSEENLTVATVS